MTNLVDDVEINDVQNINVSIDSDKQSSTSVSDKSNDIGYKLINCIESGYILKDFDQTYFYKPIMDPENISTTYFSCHCNINDEKIDNSEGSINKWYTKNQCLSKSYMVASVEGIVQDLTKQLSLSNCKVLDQNTPFYIAWSGSADKTIQVFDNDLYRDVVCMLIGRESSELDSASTKIDINVMNSYDGKSAIQLSFVINMAAIDKSGVTHNFKDYFTLNKYKHRIIHRGSINEINSNIENLSNLMETEIEILRSYIVSHEDIRNIASKLKEGKKQAFNFTMSCLSDDNKTLFHTLLIASYYLDMTYSAKRHNALFLVVNSLIDDAHTIYNKKKNKKISEETK